MCKASREEILKAKLEEPKKQEIDKKTYKRMIKKLIQKY